jgi:ABC-type lipoprotein export system ATPase subunit
MNSAHTKGVVLAAVGLERAYESGGEVIHALRAASCEVLLGQKIALTGPSGSGKSTLLHIMAGLDNPTGGSVSWPELGDVSTLRPGPIGVVFQAPSLLPPLTVIENVALPLLLKGATDREATRVAAEALSLLEMQSLANKLPEELSGGQAQRVAIARVLAGSPRLILADEPTGQLDHETATHVINVLIAASDASGAALLINTHDPLIADRFPIRWTMADGVLTTTMSVPVPSDPPKSDSVKSDSAKSDSASSDSASSAKVRATC